MWQIGLTDTQAARLSGPSVNGPAWRIEEQSTVKNPPSQDKKNKPFGWRPTDRKGRPKVTLPWYKPAFDGLVSRPRFCPERGEPEGKIIMSTRLFFPGQKS